MGLLEVGDRGTVVADRDGGVAASAAAREMLGVEFEGPREPPDRLAGLLGGEVEHAELADEPGLVGVPGDQPAEVADGGLVVLPRRRDEAPHLEGGLVVGVVGQHARHVGEGGVGVAGLLVDAGPQQPRRDVAGIDLEGPLEVRQGAIAIARRGTEPGPLHERARGVGRQFDGPIERPQGVVEPLLHHAGHAERLVETGVVLVLGDGGRQVFPGAREILHREPVQPPGPADGGVARGQVDGLVVLAVAFLALGGQRGEHEPRPGHLQAVVAEQFERLAGRDDRAVPVPAGQRLEPGDHQVRLSQRRIAAHDLLEIPHGDLPHPRPMRVGGRGVADRLDEHRGPVDERARVELLGEPPRLRVEPLGDRPPAERQHVVEVVEILDRELRVHGGVKIILAGRRGGGGGGSRRIGGQAAGGREARGEQGEPEEKRRAHGEAILGIRSPVGARSGRCRSDHQYAGWGWKKATGAVAVTHSGAGRSRRAKMTVPTT